VATFTKPTPIGAIFAAAAISAVILRLVLVYRDNERMLKASRDEALRDPLTGLGNRRGLHNDFTDLRAGGTPLVFAVYDVDGFEQYNDTHGHAAGRGARPCCASARSRGVRARRRVPLRR
jgi:GGDEF domain-containing protein